MECKQYRYYQDFGLRPNGIVYKTYNPCKNRRRYRALLADTDPNARSLRSRAIRTDILLNPRPAKRRRGGAGQLRTGTDAGNIGAIGAIELNMV
jgi:hypothetical protein